MQGMNFYLQEEASLLSFLFSGSLDFRCLWSNHWGLCKDGQLEQLLVMELEASPR